MQHDFSKVFDTESPYWQRVLDIFEQSKIYPKQVIKNRNLHHKFPRSFSKKLGEPVDNDYDNLISLSLSDHFLVHYYYYLLAKKGFRGAMATAFRYMARNTIKYLTPDTVEAMAIDYANLNEISNQHQSEVISEKWKSGHYANKRKLTEQEQISLVEKRNKTINERYSDEEKARINYERGKTLRGKTYEEAFGKEKANELKQKRSLSNKNRDYSVFKKPKPTLLVKCVETGEIHYMNEWIKILNCKSISSIHNVLDKNDKTCRKLHFVREKMELLNTTNKV